MTDTLDQGLLARREAIIAQFPDPSQAVLLAPPFLRQPPEVDNVPGHTRVVFDHVTFPRVVDWVISVAREQRYGALAACGHSGLMVAGAAGYILRVPVIAVRKRDDWAHDSRSVNAVLASKDVDYAFVDDLIASGETFLRVITRVYDRISENAFCRGILLYNARPDTDKILTEIGIANHQTRHILEACRARVFTRPRTTNSEFAD